jgi:hypothetical protein
MAKSKKKIDYEKIEKSLFRLEVLRDALELMQAKIIFLKIHCKDYLTTFNLLNDIVGNLEKYANVLSEIIQELDEEWSKLKQH